MRRVRCGLNSVHAVSAAMLYRKQKRERIARLNLRLLGPAYWPAWLGVGLLRVLACLPFPLLVRLGRGLGRLMPALAKKRAAVARRNLELCFPELDADERERLLAAHFASLGISVGETALAWWGSDQRLAGLVDLSGLHNLEAAAAEGKGVLLLSAHFTCLEIGGKLLSAHFPIDAMYRQSDNPVFEHAIANGRRRICVELIPRDAVKAMVRRLRAGHAIWYAPDQNTQRKKSVFVRFFGHLASTTPATHRLAKMTGARVVPFKAVRKRDDSGYLLTIEPALNDFPGNDVEADTQRINDIIERWVREDPEQYLWVHQRFRTRPSPSDSKIY